MGLLVRRRCFTTERKNSGIDVTGTVTADGLTVDAAGSILNLNGSAYGQVRNTQNTLILEGQGGDGLWLRTGASSLKRQTIANNGDISFYEDTGTTAKFFWDASAESLGIGRTPTSDKLEIDGSGIKFTNTPSGSGLKMYNSSSHLVRIVRDGNDLVLGASDDSNGSERMRIDSSGNVGIGTTSPSAALHVRNNDAVLILDDANNGTGGTAYRPHQEFWANGTRVGSIGMADSNDLEIIADDYNSASINFDTGGSERMRIDSNGKVGIGTSSPQEELDIYASVPTIRFSDTDGSYSRVAHNAATLLLQADEGGVGTGYMQLDVGGSERMRIDSSGNVGIGTSSPQSALHVVDSGNPTLTISGSDGAYTSILKIQAAGGGSSVINATGATSDALVLQTTGTERMRIDQVKCLWPLPMTQQVLGQMMDCTLA